MRAEFNRKVGKDMTHTPYGYHIENGIAVVDEADAERVRMLFQEYIDCKSMRAAAKKAGIDKTHSVIGRFLKNKVYLGTSFYPKIIDEDIFVRVQEIRENNARSQNRIGAIDIEHDRLEEVTEILKKAREKRNQALLEVLDKQGYTLTEADLKVIPNQKYIGKPHFAIALKNKGYISETKEAFEEGRLLESREAKAIDNIYIDTDCAIEVIRDAGGVSVLAHPMKIKGIGEKGSDEFFENLEVLLGKLKKLGSH